MIYNAMHHRDDGLLDYEPGMQILLPSEEATPEQAATQYANITVDDSNLILFCNP